jgi:hypothetical protein
MTIPLGKRILSVFSTALTAAGATISIWLQDEMWTIGQKVLLQLATGLFVIGFGFSFYLSSNGLFSIQSRPVRIVISIAVSIVLVVVALWVYSIRHPNTMD